jgi:hypothetical protein
MVLFRRLSIELTIKFCNKINHVSKTYLRSWKSHQLTHIYGLIDGWIDVPLVCFCYFNQFGAAIFLFDLRTAKNSWCSEKIQKFLKTIDILKKFWLFFKIHETFKNSWKIPKNSLEILWVFVSSDTLGNCWQLISWKFQLSSISSCYVMCFWMWPSLNFFIYSKNFFAIEINTSTYALKNSYNLIIWFSNFFHFYVETILAFGKIE